MIRRTDDRVLGDLLRDLAPQVLGAVVRRYGRFDLAEDAVQAALIDAADNWPVAGTPDNPKGWLIRVASRRLIDQLRSDQARRRREDTVHSWTLTEASVTDQPDQGADDSLILLFMCCHPSLPIASQIALSLRSVAGLTTAEIARSFLTPHDTMTRRITRAKATITTSGTPFQLPTPNDLPARVSAVLHVIYLVYTQAYASSAAERPDLANDAIRLARLVNAAIPTDTEAAGLLAMILLTEARRPARLTPGGDHAPLADQDRALWDRAMIDEGVQLLTDTLRQGDPGPYQLQAAIAAVHDEADRYDQTDWPEIVALYDLLRDTTDNPVVRLNHAVAVAMADGPSAGLTLLEALANDDRLANDHRLPAARAQLHELLGEHTVAIAHYRTAIARTTNTTTRRYLTRRAMQLRNEPDRSD